MDSNRNTVLASCPYCGASQEIDPAQSVAVCRYCGGSSPVSDIIGKNRERCCQSPGPDGEPLQFFPRFNPSNSPEPPKPKKRHTFWWIVGWIFCFPIPLTILVARSRKLCGLVKAVIIAAAWIVYLVLGATYRPGTNGSTPKTERAPAVVETTSTPRPTARPTATVRPTATTEPVEEDAVEEEPAEEPAEETPEPTPEPTPAPTGVTPEFKEAMDSYEAFFDEYCDFMKKMSDDPTDFTILMEYAEVMTRYADIMDKLDAIDEDELSPADEAYYIESMARIEVKLLEAANYMS